MASQKYKFVKGFFFKGKAHLEGSVIEIDEKEASVHVKIGKLTLAGKDEKVNHITPASNAAAKAKAKAIAEAEEEEEESPVGGKKK